MALGNGKKTKGRQRRENRLVEDKTSRQVTFSKRKSGLWKKVADLAVLCRAKLAVVVFSRTGRAFAFGTPSVEAVLSYADNIAVPAAAAYDVDWKAMEKKFREIEEKPAEVKAEEARMIAIGKKVVEVQKQTGKGFWWEVDPEALDAEELPVFVKSLERIRANVRRHANDRLSTQFVQG
jgi:hypothetical protein